MDGICNDNILERSCPICDSSEKSILYKQRFSVIEKASLLRGYDVVACNQCGFFYADHIPCQDDFDEYYSKLSAYEYKYKYCQTGVPDFYESRLNKLAELFEVAVPVKSKRILEIGCSTGSFLGALKNKGYSDLTGVDPSEYCVAFINDNREGLVAFNGTIHSLENVGKNYDVVILWAVLEHIVEIKSAMKKVVSVLNDEGMCFIGVPNASDFLNYLGNAPFQDFSSEHINFFTELSLCTLLGLFNFEPTGCVDKKTITELFTSLYAELFVKNSKSIKSLQEYICESDIKAGQVSENIDVLRKSGKPIVLWGVGTQLRRLLAETRLSECNIVCVIDSNENYKGRLVNGITVDLPQALKNHSCGIVITSPLLPTRNEIIHTIKHELKCENEIIDLFGERYVCHCF